MKKYSPLRPPNWIDVPVDTIINLDLGHQFKPVSQREWELSMLLMRGPVTLVAGFGVPERIREVMPIVAFDVRISQNATQRLEIDSSIGHLGLYVQGSIRERDGRLFFVSPYSGEIVIRKTTLADLRHAEMANESISSIDEFLEQTYGKTYAT